MTTIDQARSAKSALKTKLAQDFAGATLITGVGLTSVAADYSVKVNLVREPTAQEKPLLPAVYQNVKVIYEVIGDVSAGKKGCGQPGHVCSCANGPK